MLSALIALLFVPKLPEIDKTQIAKKLPQAPPVHAVSASGGGYVIEDPEVAARLREMITRSPNGLVSRQYVIDQLSDYSFDDDEDES